MRRDETKKTTVLINALSARQGGGQTYVTNLLDHLPPCAPMTVYVLAPDTLPLPGHDPRIRRIPAPEPLQNPLLRTVWEKFRLPALVSQLRADVLFCPGGIIGGRVPRGCKTVTMFRNMIPFSDAQNRRYRPGYMRLRNVLLKHAFLRSMGSADLVIFLSHHARTTIEAHLGDRLGNAVTIPHGLARAFRRPDPPRNRSRAAILPLEGYLLYVSTLDYYKAQIEVVQAFALLREKRVTKEKLLLVGPEFPEYGRAVRKTIADLRLQDSVVLTGPVPHAEMPEIYRNSIVNIFASECENCPNILIEALASGRPILSSHDPPMPEFGGDAALYFDPRSPGDLAGKLAALLVDPPRMKELAARAEQRSQLFDWESCAQRTWQSILGLTEN
jgi:glycosyltransferase involved in cell wall biosynthesis